MVNIDIKPIKTEAEYEAALALIDTLLDAKPGSSEEAALELFSILVEAYESQIYPIDPPDPIEAIKFAMEQKHLNKKDLEVYIGSRSRVYEVMHHKRPLTLSMIRKLHNGLGIPAGVLISNQSDIRNP